MKLFMSKGLCRFLDYQIKLERLDDNRVKLIFCNLKKDRNGKEKYVKLIEQIQFYDIEPDWGQEIVKVYFVKINVLYGETIPFYFSYRDNFEYLRQHLIFCDDNWEHSIDTGNYCTKIKLDCSKRKEYISLSEL